MQVFSYEFCKFLRAPFFIEQPQRLLLALLCSNYATSSYALSFDNEGQKLLQTRSALYD